MNLGEQATVKLLFIFASIATSNISLFACGNIDRVYERFGDVSRGRQCVFMSLSARL